MAAGRRLDVYLIHTARAVSRESTSNRIDRRMYSTSLWGRKFATGTARIARGAMGSHVVQ